MSEQRWVDVAALRREYAPEGLAETDLAADPVRQLRGWLADAVDVGTVEPNAMVLATVGADGAPSARTVLLRGLEDRGLVFYSSYDSRKARELDGNARAALVFPWLSLSRQACIRGRVTRLDPAESDAYFASRPRGAQLGAWASHQSQVLANRGQLEAQMAEVAERFAGGPVPRPPYWGGFLLDPDEVEFWQGRPNRLHDRLVYLRDGDGWRVERRSP